MTVWSGPLLVACGLLVAGGALKVVRPHDTARALSAAGLPGGPRAVRVLSVAEVVIGAAAALTGAAAPVAGVALSYAAFTSFVGVALLRRLPLSTCGCLGGIDTPPTRTHVAVNAALAAAATAAWVEGVPPLHEVLAAQPAAGAPFLLLAGLSTWFTVVLLSELPRARSVLGGSGR